MTTQRGSMLVEVIVALVILEVLFVAAWSSLGSAVSRLTVAAERGEGLLVAEALADSAAWFAAALGAPVSGPWGRIETSTASGWLTLHLFAQSASTGSPWGTLEVRLP